MKAMEVKTKIELAKMPVLEKVSDITGDHLLNNISEVLSCHQQLKELIVKYKSLESQREEAATAADEYLKIGLHQTTTNDTRKYVVRGIEAEMNAVLQTASNLKDVLQNYLYE